MKVNGISDQARLLHSALIQRNLPVELEKFDGHKHVDLAIESAGLYIEVDGDRHYTDAATIMRDFERDYFSTEAGVDSLHLPNHVIDDDLDGVSDAIAAVVRRRAAGAG